MEAYLTTEFFGRVEKTLTTHLGKLCLMRLEERADGINQLNITTGHEETHSSVRLRSIRVAQSLTSRDIGVGDVIVVCGKNHPDVSIPIIASLYVGSTIMALSVEMKHSEVKHMSSIGLPRIVFCDPEVVSIFEKVLKELELDCEIIIFGDNESDDHTSYSDIEKATGNEADFQVSEFDPETTIAFVVSSSGTTGLPKGVSLTHRNFALQLQFQDMFFKGSGIDDASLLLFAPIRWVTGALGILQSCILGLTRMQTHLGFTPDIAIDAINKYKPTSAIMGSMYIMSLISHPRFDECDFSSFASFMCIGSSIYTEYFEKLQAKVTNGSVLNHYGMTECAGGISINMGAYKPKTVGKAFPWAKLKIVDPETDEDMSSNEIGEIRIQSPFIVSPGYYRSPEATAAAFDSENWLRSGDLGYVDDEGDIFIVDRIKEMIKCRCTQVTPAEVENVICSHPSVLAACVVGVSHPIDMNRPLAFVQRKQGCQVTAKEIKDIVKSSLSDAKQLRGGVVFMDKLPLTYTGKINRKALNMLKTSAIVE